MWIQWEFENILLKCKSKKVNQKVNQLILPRSLHEVLHLTLKAIRNVATKLYTMGSCKFKFLLKRKKWANFLHSVKLFLLLKVCYLSHEKEITLYHIYAYPTPEKHLDLLIAGPWHPWGCSVSKQNLHLVLCCYIPSSTCACREIQSLCRGIHSFFTVLFNCSVP